MGEVLGRLLDGLMGIFTKHYRRPKLWIAVGMVVLAVVFLLPYIDSNVFYFSRMEKRIAILEQAISLDQEAIESNPVFLNEYRSILQEIEQQSERSFNSVSNRLGNLIGEVITMGRGQGNKGIQFLTGALWCILLALCVPFMKTFNGRGEKMIVLVVVILLGCVLGALAVWLPVIISPWVNYIGFPLLQLILFLWWGLKSGSSSAKGDQGAK